MWLRMVMNKKPQNYEILRKDVGNETGEFIVSLRTKTGSFETSYLNEADFDADVDRYTKHSSEQRTQRTELTAAELRQQQAMAQQQAQAPQPQAPIQQPVQPQVQQVPLQQQVPQTTPAQ